jgi:hypothetical protein
MRPLDTTPYAHQVQIEIFRRMRPEERLRSAVSLAQTSRELLKEGVRRRHPDYSEEQVRLAVIRIMLGEDLFLLAYAEAKDALP